MDISQKKKKRYKPFGKILLSDVIMETQIKIVYYYIPVRMAKIENTDKSNAGEEMEKQELSSLLVEI